MLSFEASVLTAAVNLLACPHCTGSLDLDPASDQGQALLCDRGHSFDIARQGYVSLLAGSTGGIVGDSADMVAARVRFFATGHFDPLCDAVADQVRGSGSIADIGSGTGDYLVRALDAAPNAVGVGIDVSKYAARRSARAHPRAVAVVADVWRALPLVSGGIETALSVFSPRNVPEMRRILTPGGSLVVLTPTEGHLAELAGPLSLIGVQPDKSRRLGESMAGSFRRARRVPLTYSVAMTRAAIADLVDMGPSARHGGPERRRALHALADETTVTVSVVVSVFERL